MEEQEQKHRKEQGPGLELLVREFGYKSMLLETQFEVSPEAILITNIQGEILVYNKFFGEIWGISDKLFITKNVKKLFEFILKQVKSPKNLHSFVHNLYRLENEKSKIEVEIVDGRFFEINSSPMINKNNENLGRAWFLRDITQQRKRDEGIENYVSTLNHDLRSPAATIMSFANLLLEDEFSHDEINNIVKIIESSSKKMLEMMNNYLILLKIERDEKKLGMKMIKIPDLILEIEKIIIELNFQNRFKLLIENPDNFQVNSDLPNKSVLLQKNLFFPLLTNLVNNAVEAVNEKNSFDVVSIEKQKIAINLYEVDDLLYLSVTNVGEISEEIKKNLFQKFNTSKKNGNGLGLYSAKLIAKVHGGNLTYQALPGATRFVLKLPLH